MSSSSRIPDPESVANREFPTVRRGYDPSIVKRFLAELAQHLRAVRAAKLSLASRLFEAERKAQSPSFDEETLSAAVGSETARILHVGARGGGGSSDEGGGTRRSDRRRGGDRGAAKSDLARKPKLRRSSVTRANPRRVRSRLRAPMVERWSRRHENFVARSSAISPSGVARSRRRSNSSRREKTACTPAVAHVADAIADVRERLQASDEEARTAAEGARRRSGVDHREIESEKEQAKSPGARGPRGRDFRRRDGAQASLKKRPLRWVCRSSRLRTSRGQRQKAQRARQSTSYSRNCGPPVLRQRRQNQSRDSAAIAPPGAPTVPRRSPHSDARQAWARRFSPIERGHADAMLGRRKIRSHRLEPRC